MQDKPARRQASYILLTPEKSDIMPAPNNRSYRSRAEKQQIVQRQPTEKYWIRKIANYQEVKGKVDDIDYYEKSIFTFHLIPPKNQGL